MDPVPWREAWHQALYAAGRGFYVARGGPAAHFTTATQGPTGAALARALLQLPDHPVRVVVDIGAGRGELVTHLLAALSDASGANRSGAEPTALRNAPSGPERNPRGPNGPGTRLVAVDVVERPAGLDDRIDWLRSPGGAALPGELSELEDALVIAHEWLDVVPCTVAEVDVDGVVREVLVDPETGDESLGGPVPDRERQWAEKHWATNEPGSRVEIGLARDDAWARLVARVRSGTVVAVDYGHTAAARPHEGTLTAYVRGRLTRPVPDGSCDITAHVSMDTLGADMVVTQREALHSLGVSGTTPAHELATTDPAAYLAALELAGAHARLLDPAGFGGFWWAVQRVRGGHVT